MSERPSFFQIKEPTNWDWVPLVITVGVSESNNSLSLCKGWLLLCGLKYLATGFSRCWCLIYMIGVHLYVHVCRKHSPFLWHTVFYNFYIWLCKLCWEFYNSLWLSLFMFSQFIHWQGKTYQVKAIVNCKASNVVYMIEWGRCGKQQYVGETENALHIRTVWMVMDRLDITVNVWKNQCMAIGNIFGLRVLKVSVNKVT